MQTDSGYAARLARAFLRGLGVLYSLVGATDVLWVAYALVLPGIRVTGFDWSEPLFLLFIGMTSFTLGVPLIAGVAQRQLRTILPALAGGMYALVLVRDSTLGLLGGLQPLLLIVTISLGLGYIALVETDASNVSA